jgi:hypothetical protein
MQDEKTEVYRNSFVANHRKLKKNPGFLPAMSQMSRYSSLNHITLTVGVTTATNTIFSRDVPHV